MGVTGCIWKSKNNDYSLQLLGVIFHGQIPDNQTAKIHGLIFKYIARSCKGVQIWIII